MSTEHTAKKVGVWRAPRFARAVLARETPTTALLPPALAAAGALILAACAHAADLPVLTTGHTDVGVNYEEGGWDLHVHAEELGLEYEPDGVWLRVGSSALSRVPANAPFGFLGAVGAPVWVLPAVENPELLFLGLGTEELASGIFSNDTVRLSLRSVTGPGGFCLYTLDPFGAPVVAMNSRDGIDAGDACTLTAGGHVHANWAFTTPGQYRLGLQASGLLADTGETTTSEIVEYLFEVEPLRVESGHVGVSVAYNPNSGGWNLAAGHAALGLKFAPDQVRWIAKPTALQFVPEDSRFAFLGAAGDPVWVLPEVQHPDLLWPGFGLQAVPAGVFTGDDVTIRLVGMAGPGDFFLYHSDALGNPVVAFNTRDGIDTNDVKLLKAGSHVHLNWGFTKPGVYRVSLQVRANRVDGGESSSAMGDYYFEVEEAPLLWVARKDVAWLTLRWFSRMGREYQLQSTANLAGGSWADHPGVDPVGGTGGLLTVDVPTEEEEGPRFFRLEIHGEPDHDPQEEQ